MTRAAFRARFLPMRTPLIITALAAIAVATPAAAQSGCDLRQATAVEEAIGTPIIAIDDMGDVAPPPAPLAELAADSSWRGRFEAAADELFPALQSGEAGRWQPLLGGRWLGESDRRSVAALLKDRCGVFRPLVDARTPVARRILGWSVPSSYSAAERADIAARPEAEALVCWSTAAAWPRTAAEADNAPGRAFGCARIAYSLRDGTPRWRAFVETPAYPAR